MFRQKWKRQYNVNRKRRDKFRKYVDIGIRCWDLVFGISMLWMQSHGAQALNKSNWHAKNMCEDSLYLSVSHIWDLETSHTSLSFLPDCAADTSAKSIFLENAFVVIWLCQQLENAYVICAMLKKKSNFHWHSKWLFFAVRHILHFHCVRKFFFLSFWTRTHPLTSRRVDEGNRNEDGFHFDSIVAFGEREEI